MTPTWLRHASTAAAAATAAAAFAGSAGAAPAAAPRNVTPPTVSGTPREGGMLTATAGTWQNNPTSFAYRWQRCSADGASCTNIAGETRRTYSPNAADVDRTLRVAVTASNADGEATAFSRTTDPVSSRSEPRNVERPTIAGVPRVGEELTANPGTWTGGVRSFSYQWQRCDVDGTNCRSVGGATGRTYGVRAADAGQTLRVAVTATNEAGSTTVTSDRTRAVAGGSTPPPPPPSPPPPPAQNRRPTLVVLSGRFLGARVYIRMRICDDSRKNVTIVARDSKSGVLAYTRRFTTLTPPRPCGVYTRSWVPAQRFRTRGRFVVTLWARDKSGLTSRPVRRVFFR